MKPPAAGELALHAPWPDAEEYGQREWLVTNGLGGYSSMTLAGALTRRYHGLFMPNLIEPRGRHLLVSRLDEWLDSDGSATLIGGGDVHGAEGWQARLRWLQAFRAGRSGLYWRFQVGDRVLEKRLLMPHRRNVVQVCYRLIEGGEVALRLRPFLPLRRQDAVLGTTADPPVQAQLLAGGEVRCGREGSALHVRLHCCSSGRFVPAAEWAIDQLLVRERLRGYACQESTSSPGYVAATLRAGESLCLTFCAPDEPEPDSDFDAQWHAEQARADALVQRCGAGADPFAAALVLAADQFIVEPGSRLREQVAAGADGHALRTVVAGYHWFGDWGRDTMISLEGLMLCTGRLEEARATLLTFAHYVRDGLLPNLFPEGAEDGLYHTVDASLWYFHAVQRYLHHGGHRDLLTQLLPVLRDIVAHYQAGTRFGIGADPADGLIVARSSQHPLTWMDAHYKDQIVTPRRGKPVEIQALWYNALRLLAGWEEAGSAQASECQTRAERVRAAFNARFWNEAARCLYDVVDGDEPVDARLRPNQIFAFSLDHPVLDPQRWAAVLEVVRAQLQTPFGLRTLSRGHREYRPTYHGSLADRDAAYHQGTVWPWLLGHYVDAWLRVHADDRAGARALLLAFPGHLLRAGIGSISEVFDAEAPHGAHGCIAQAWSVAEVLRAWLATAPVSARR